MAIIAIGSTKGGSGKTTAAILLATQFASGGLKVALLDGDPDARAGEWFQVWAPATGYSLEALTTDSKTDMLLEPHEHNGIVYVPGVYEDNMLDEIEHYNEIADIVLVDLQGSANQSMLLACGAADLVVIPVMPSRFDLKGMIRTVKSVRSAARSTRREIPHWVLLTCTATTLHQTKVDKYTRKQAEDLGLPLFNVELGYRTAFRRMTHEGLPPNKDTEKAAAENVAAFAKEVALVLQGKHPAQSVPTEVIKKSS